VAPRRADGASSSPAQNHQLARPDGRGRADRARPRTGPRAPSRHQFDAPDVALVREEDRGLRRGTRRKALDRGPSGSVLDRRRLLRAQADALHGLALGLHATPKSIQVRTYSAGVNLSHFGAALSRFGIEPIAHGRLVQDRLRLVVSDDEQAAEWARRFCSHDEARASSSATASGSVSRCASTP
jgi:hypothetical protein